MEIMWTVGVSFVHSDYIVDAVLVVHELSMLLGCGLDRETVDVCLKLCDLGVNPESLSAVIKELKREKVVSHNRC